MRSEQNSIQTILLSLLLLAASAVPSYAQWEIEESHTTASLRGIHNVGGGVAWASGTNGTVLRTEDGGYLWQTCAIPPDAEKLDFRGIQAFDENTAIVMSSGPGDQSRLYKTTDGCQTWKLLFTNPDKDGFWTHFSSPQTMTRWHTASASALCLEIRYRTTSPYSYRLTAVQRGNGRRPFRSRYPGKAPLPQATPH